MKKLLAKNRNQTAMKNLSLVPVMNQSPTEVQIQNQTIVTRVVMMHQVHHHLDRTLCYIFVLLFTPTSHFMAVLLIFLRLKVTLKFSIPHNTYYDKNIFLNSHTHSQNENTQCAVCKILIQKFVTYTCSSK